MLIKSTPNSSSLENHFYKTTRGTLVVACANVFLVGFWYLIIGYSKPGALPLIGCFWLLAVTYVVFNNLPDFLTLSESEELNDYLVRNDTAVTNLGFTLIDLFILNGVLLIASIFIF